MKIVVTDANLSSWRDDLEAALPERDRRQLAQPHR